MAAPSQAEPLRIATFNVELARKGPGLLLRDLRRGDEQAAMVAGIIAHVAPDVIVLQGVDYDHDLFALNALAALIAEAGHTLPYRFARLPNSGMATGLDMDGNNRLGEPRDAQGYGRFAGQGGMAILSALPIDAEASRDFSSMLWRDLPGEIAPRTDGRPFPSVESFAAQRLSTVAHWDVALTLRDGTPFRLMSWHATPPVFDGDEDLNGRRNHDETAFWLRYLDGALAMAPDAAPFVIIGDANADPHDGDGRRTAIQALLADPRVQDPEPRAPGGPVASLRDKGVNENHTGDPALDTADWRDDGPNDPGNLRVDYVLPSTDWRIIDSGVFWPAPGDPLADLLGVDGNGASRHRLVWVDLELTQP